MREGRDRGKFLGHPSRRERGNILLADPARCGHPRPADQHSARGRIDDHGIEVTAIHNHMLDDQPHLYFPHFWANDDARKLAEGLKAALAQINIAKS